MECTGVLMPSHMLLHPETFYDISFIFKIFIFKCRLSNKNFHWQLMLSFDKGLNMRNDSLRGLQKMSQKVNGY